MPAGWVAARGPRRVGARGGRGAIGGNAGEGAAIGAGVGALFGAVRARWMEEQQQQQMGYAAQQQSALAQGRSRYNQAFGACMSSRLHGELGRCCRISRSTVNSVLYNASVATEEHRP